MAQASDDADIRNLVARLAQLADDGELSDLDEYASLFTEDADWEMALPGRGSQKKGRGNIKQGAIERRTSGTQGPGSGIRHAITSLVIKINGDRATARSYPLIVKSSGMTATLTALFIYDDSFQKTPEGWKLASRRISPS